MFPADIILIARGKYSTLNHEWREQIKRVQDICRTMQGTTAQIQSEAQEKPPIGLAPHIATMDKCLENLKAARERLLTTSLGMAELEPEAWGKE